MGQKKITDLTLRSSIVDSCNFVVDDGVQTFRVTAPQLFDYLLPLFTTAVTISAAGTTLTSANRIVLLDPTSAPFTQALPDCTLEPVGLILEFKNIALPSNANAVTLDASGTQLIDDALTLVLNSSLSMDAVRLYNTGAKWLIL